MSRDLSLKFFEKGCDFFSLKKTLSRISASLIREINTEAGNLDTPQTLVHVQDATDFAYTATWLAKKHNVKSKGSCAVKM